MVEISNTISNIFSGVSSYQLLVDIVIPISSVILGVILEHKYKIIDKVKEKIQFISNQSGKGNVQSTTQQKSGRDSVSATISTPIKGPVIGDQHIYPTATVPTVAENKDALVAPEPLVQKQYQGTNTDHIIDCFEKYSDKFKIPETFKNDFTKVHKDLNTYKNTDTSSSEYFRIFKDIVKNLTNKKLFCERDGVDIAIVNVKNTFNKLEKLMVKQNKKFNDLEILIEDFEKNIVTLFAYI